MSFKKVASACVGAALSLAVASFGASAADYTPMKPLQPPPAPPPPLDIHGFFDVTFSNDYITPRGLLVTNTGLTTQIVNGLTFSLYKDPNTWINSFSITAGTFNDLWSKQDNVTVGSWNEFDWWVSADWTVARYWKTGVTYITFLSPPGNFRQERSNALFDQRQRFVFSGVLSSPPAWRSGDGLHKFLADFTIAPIIEISSGRPFNILSLGQNREVSPRRYSGASADAGHITQPDDQGTSHLRHPPPSSPEACA